MPASRSVELPADVFRVDSPVHMGHAAFSLFLPCFAARLERALSLAMACCSYMNTRGARALRAEAGLGGTRFANAA